MPKIDTSALYRWRTARRITLGAIAIAGTMATASAVAHRVADHPCGYAQAQVDELSISGIGVVIMQDGKDVVVTRVLDNAPADGKIHPGAVLLSVDGKHPRHLEEWSSSIRGEQGTKVELEVMYPCSGQDTVVIERELIHLTKRDLLR